MRCSSDAPAEIDPTPQVLKNHKHGWVFAEPVDPIKLGIPDYFQIIKKPMDLSTVKVRLGSRSARTRARLTHGADATTAVCAGHAG